jgi:hypothetical protein
MRNSNLGSCSLWLFSSLVCLSGLCPFRFFLFIEFLGLRYFFSLLDFFFLKQKIVKEKTGQKQFQGNHDWRSGDDMLLRDRASFHMHG